MMPSDENPLANVSSNPQRNEHLLHEGGATSLPLVEESGYDSSLAAAMNSSVALHLDTELVAKDIQKWEEYYDHMKTYLQSKPLENSVSNKRLSKASINFSLEEDGNMYYNKPSKDGNTMSKLLVIRSYDERVRICKAIHLNTGTDGIHFRRDTMLAAVGQLYYWKGQRRDVCECIASCEMCCTGLGAKRRTKPPRQSRDVRPSKLPRLTGPTFKEPISSVPPSMTTASAVSTQELGLAIKMSNVTTNVSRSQLLPEAEAIFTSASSTRFQPIFTTIVDEPIIAAEACANIPCTSSLPIDIHVLNTTPDSCSSNTSSPSARWRYSSDSSSIQDDHPVPIYQSLFNLPSQPNSTIAPSVVRAMQSAIAHSADPIKLRDAAQMALKHSLKLSDMECTVLIAPSRAAAYAVAVAAGMLRIDPLSVNQGISSYPCSPMAVIHDACCQVGGSSSLKSCSSLVGAYNWNLGTLTTPMDRKMLTMAVRNNRVAAVLHQPFAYMEHCQCLSLQVISTICHSHAVEVATIVDAAGLNVHTHPLERSLQEFFAAGAEAVLLPDTEVFSGPPHTCILVGKESLLSEICMNLSLLQAQIALPLSCPSYEIVGTVVAFLSASETIA